MYTNSLEMKEKHRLEAGKLKAFSEDLEKQLKNQAELNGPEQQAIMNGL
jgi:hypothetical protein